METMHQNIFLPVEQTTGQKSTWQGQKNVAVWCCMLISEIINWIRLQSKKNNINKNNNNKRILAGIIESCQLCLGVFFCVQHAWARRWHCQVTCAAIRGMRFGKELAHWFCVTTCISKLIERPDPQTNSPLICFNFTKCLLGARAAYQIESALSDELKKRRFVHDEQRKEAAWCQRSVLLSPKTELGMHNVEKGWEIHNALP